MVADMEGASKDSLEAAANQIKEESFDAIGRLAGFNLVYHLTGKNRLSIDQEGAETALPAASGSFFSENQKVKYHLTYFLPFHDMLWL